MTTDNPEQEARAGVMAMLRSAYPDGKFSGDEARAALDRLCTERYLAGKVAGLRGVVCARTDAHLPDACVIDVEDFKAMTAEAEAEYAACVAEIREAAK